MSLVFLPLADHAPPMQQVATISPMPALHPQSGFMCIGGPTTLGPQMVITQSSPILKPNSAVYSTATKVSLT